MIIYSPNPTFVPSLSEIGDLSCITSCLVLPGFLMDTLLKDKNHVSLLQQSVFIEAFYGAVIMESTQCRYRIKRRKINIYLD